MSHFDNARYWRILKLVVESGERGIKKTQLDGKVKDIASTNTVTKILGQLHDGKLIIYPPKLQGWRTGQSGSAKATEEGKKQYREYLVKNVIKDSFEGKELVRIEISSNKTELERKAAREELSRRLYKDLALSVEEMIKRIETSLKSMRETIKLRKKQHLDEEGTKLLESYVKSGEAEIAELKEWGKKSPEQVRGVDRAQYFLVQKMIDDFPDPSEYKISVALPKGLLPEEYFSLQYLHNLVGLDVEKCIEILDRVWMGLPRQQSPSDTKMMLVERGEKVRKEGFVIILSYPGSKTEVSPPEPRKFE